MVHIVEPVALTFLIIEVARLIRSRFHGALEDRGTGLTAGEARTLLYVGRTPGTRQTDLAIRMQVEPMTLVGFLDRLEARGLIARTTDPNDRRAKTIHPTKAAEPLIRRIDELSAQTRAVATADLTEKEIETMMHGLVLMRRALVRDTRELEPALA